MLRSHSSAIAAFVLRYPKTIAFAAGLVSATGFAPLSFWPLTILAFAVLIALLAEAKTVWRAAGLGWWFGLGQFVLGLNWIATSFTYQAAMPAWLGWIAVVLLSLYLALYPLVATVAAWAIARRYPAVTGLALAGTWAVGEYLRGTCFTGFAWNPVGVALVDRSIAGVATVLGTYGLSAMVVLMGWLIAVAVRGPDRRWAYAPAVMLLLLQGAAALVPPAPQPTRHAPLLHIVQPNIGQQDKWREDFEAQNFARLASLSGRPGPRPRLLLWPEAAVPDYLELDALARNRLAALLGPRDVMMTGGVSLVTNGTQVTAARNSLFTLDAGGRLLGRYDKAHLVPYGEYLPMRPLLSALGLSRLAPGDLDFLPGPGPRSVDVPGFGRAGIQICYEMIFSGHVIDDADRPSFVFNPSNDAWFGAWGPPQHLAQARLRAIEEGLPVLRSTPTGISAVIAADGRLEKALPWRVAGAIETVLPAPKPPTPFSRLGNILPGLFALALIAAAIAARWRFA
ncbi:apolipoprotein N-acyltransferase [Sphingomonas sp. ID0503]|uniref:apolipoprotein N-acyltransferase n=1 Tax=Sphingomonas sp. ID0503 TaxID=3399691 RepID=UPI003AFA7D80